MDTKMISQFSIMDTEMLACVEGGDNSYGFWYRIGGLVRDGFDLYVENQRRLHAMCPLCIQGGNIMKNKYFETLSAEELTQVQGGGIPWWTPIIPNYDQILGSICGFIDGFSKSTNRGQC